MPWTLETIHPLFVHFPIALFSTGLLFDILSRLWKNYEEELDSVGLWIMGVALLSSSLTTLTGIIAYIKQGTFSHLLNFNHGILAMLSIIIFSLLFWVRIEFQLDLRYSIIKRNVYLFIQILSTSILFYSAHLGAIAAERI
jgi:uncharacterized membrane protein